jgi:hypothetical protein
MILGGSPYGGAPVGSLAEIALVSEAEAGCPGAKILKYWEA